MSDVSNEISRLEEQIEQLSDKLEGCRKYALGARIAVIGGGLWLAALLLGLLRADALPLLVSTAAVIGGLVVGGSNRTTERETAEKLAAAEATRARLISALELHLVSAEKPSVLH